MPENPVLVRLSHDELIGGLDTLNTVHVIVESKEHRAQQHAVWAQGMWASPL